MDCFDTYWGGHDRGVPSGGFEERLTAGTASWAMHRQPGTKLPLPIRSRLWR